LLLHVWLLLLWRQWCHSILSTSHLLLLLLLLLLCHLLLWCAHTPIRLGRHQPSSCW
jgi:hypothetical protein